MSGSAKDQKKSSAKETELTRELTDAGVGDPKLREFLYLDFPKLTSYLAQSFEGLVRLQQSIIGRRNKIKQPIQSMKPRFRVALVARLAAAMTQQHYLPGYWALSSNWIARYPVLFVQVAMKNL